MGWNTIIIQSDELYVFQNSETLKFLSYSTKINKNRYSGFNKSEVLKSYIHLIHLLYALVLVFTQLSLTKKLNCISSMFSMPIRAKGRKHCNKI